MVQASSRPDSPDESSTPTRPSSWPEIEQRAVAAFSEFANPKAEGLTRTLRRAARYATIDRAAAEIVIDKRAFLLGLVSYGILETPSVSYGNSATWVGTWIASRFSGLAKACQEGVTDTDKIHEAFKAGCNVVASRSMRGVGETAIGYAKETIDRPRADLRHYFAAFARDPGAAIHEFSSLGWSPTAEDLQALKRELYERIEKTPESGEKMDAWRRILLQVQEPSREEFAGFTSDQLRVGADDSDPLDVLPEVRAFAKLICYRPTETPLSIGLFGGWGTGKTTFMQLLENEIDDLTRRTRDADQRREAQKESDVPSAKRPGFVRNIVQVRFNAWQFADANLWASLTAEFFDQLRAGGFSRTGKAVHTRLVERVGAYVHSLAVEAANTRAKLAESESRLQEAQQRHVAKVAKAKSMAGAKFKQRWVEEVTRAFDQHKDDLRELGRPIGADPVRDIGDFVELAKEVQTLPGQIVELAKFVCARGWRISLVLVGLAMIAFFSYLPWKPPADSEFASIDLTKLLLLIAGLGSFARAILPGVRLIAGVVKSTSGFASNLKKDNERQLKLIAMREAQLRSFVAEAEARRASAERAAKALARYVDPTSTTGNPPRLLRFMLEDDPDTRALEKEIGLISRVRRLFQALNVIMKEETKDPDVPDRIVIYIDDLDRCTSSQVYSVLQAIHLLLAFEIFVVVVAVDVAWVREALTREIHPAEANGAKPRPDGTAAALDQRKLAIRYMEKIFQLPYWLRRLSPAGSSAGSYGSYVRWLLSQNVAAKAGGELQHGLDQPSSEPSASPGNGAAVSDAETDKTKRGRRDEVKHEDEGTLGAILSTVEISKKEIEFISSAQIGSIIAGGEPRNVKRLINIYRLLRTGLDEKRRNEFLNEFAPEYPVVTIIIAVEIGQNIEFADELYRKALLKSNNFSDGLKAVLEPALDLAKLTRGGRPISGVDWEKWALEVRRYSFNEYTLVEDGPASPTSKVAGASAGSRAASAGRSTVRPRRA